MANKKKKIIPEEVEKIENVEKIDIIPEEKEKYEEEKPKKIEKKSKKEEKEPKYKIGAIVFIAKDTDADLNGFKLFPQYKKYTYTVEAYDEKSDVYTLRRLNLSLRLKSEFILAPNERAHDQLNRKQF